jgi:hypothetical protein
MCNNAISFDQDLSGWYVSDNVSEPPFSLWVGEWIEADETVPYAPC